MKVYTFLVFKISFILGVLLFAYGFFPITSPDRHDFSQKPKYLEAAGNQNEKTEDTKLIFIIIDALRFDFVDHRMQFVNNKVLENKFCKIKLIADSPTVTMPRIKAMLTGRTSNFLDVISNLKEKKLHSDSLIHQLVLAKKRIVFYGDNTWKNLFSNAIFHRAQFNFDSFYVNDFYNGDNNNTKNLNLELEKHDWDVLILHYLGLDHIGHVEGTASLKITPKLNEMDDIMKNIVAKIQERKNEKILLIMTSDHGMRNEGGHGGGTREETEVPLLFFGDNCTSNTYENFNQIDMASTLSTLLKLPIPANNIGKIIPNLISGLPMTEQLNALNYNTYSLMLKAEEILTKDVISNFEHEIGLAENYHEEFIKYFSNKNLFDKAKMKYVDLSKDLSDYIKDSVNYFYIDYIIVGVVMCTLSTLNVILSGGNPFDFAYTLSDSKFRLCLYFLLCITFYIGQNFLIDIENNFLWCTVPFNTFLFLNCVYSIFKINSAKIFNSFGLLNKYAVFVIAFSILSLISSSYIEEEHFTWYYCVSTLLLLLAFREYQLTIKSIVTENVRYYIWVSVLLSKSKKWIPLLLSHIFMNRINATARLTTFTNIADFIMYGEWKTLKLLYLIVALLLILLSLNEFNKKMLKLLIIIAVGSLFSCKCFQEYYTSHEISEFGFYWCLFLFYFSIFVIILYHYIFYNESKPLTEFITIYILLICLAYRLPNILLISGCICTLKFGFKALTRIYKKSSSRKLLIAESLLSYALGKMFYFYQGNSNYLGSIDIDTGILGYDTYPFLVAFIVFIRTFSFQILCFTLLLYEIIINHNKKDFYYSIYIISVYIVVRLNAYLFVMIFLKNHLFIWSVFSPKFLYEFCELFLFCSLFLIYVLYDSFNQYFNLVKKYNVI